jgi:type I restriction enzyme, S subunit
MIALRDVGRWTGGGTPSKANPKFWTNGTIPWVSPKDMKVARIAETQDYITREAVHKSATNIVGKGAVLVVVRSGILRHSLPVAIADRDVALNQDLKAVELNEGFDPDYVAWALRGAARDILHTCAKSGTTVQNLEIPRFLSFKIPNRLKPEQQRIVAEIEKQFTRLVAGVASLKRVQSELKRYRTSVLKAACEGRLVPTEAELARKENRGYETGEQLLQRILKQRREKSNGKGKYKEPAALKTVDLPTLPEGWTWATVEQLAVKVVDGTHHTPTYVTDGIAFISVKDVRDGKIHFDNCKYISAETHQELIKRCHPEEGDVLITKSGTIGRVAVVKAKRPFSLFVSVALIKLVPAFVSPNFTAIALQRYIATINIAQDVKGGLLKNLHLEDLRIVSLPLPPLVEQHRLVDEVESRLSMIGKLEDVVATQLRRAARLRQAILQNVFSPQRDGPSR